VDAAAAWAEHVEFVERLSGLAEVIAGAEPTKPAKRKPGGTGAGFDARVTALAGDLADDARIRAYEILGDRERAVSIMERRLWS
jgi:hypothetical protein